MDSNGQRHGDPWSDQRNDNVTAKTNPSKEYQQFEALDTQSRGLDSISNSLIVSNDIKNIQNFHTDNIMKGSVPDQTPVSDQTIVLHDNGKGMHAKSSINNRVGTDYTTDSTNGNTSTIKSSDTRVSQSSSIVCAVNNPFSVTTNNLQTAEKQLVNVQERLPSINESFLRKGDYEMKSASTSLLQASSIAEHAGLWGRNMFHIENFVRDLSDAVSKNAQQRIKEESYHTSADYTKGDSIKVSTQNVSVPTTSTMSSDVQEQSVEKEDDDKGQIKNSLLPTALTPEYLEQVVKKESGPSGESLEEEKSLMKADYTESVPVGPVQSASDQPSDSYTNNPSQGKKNSPSEFRVKCNFCKNTFKNNARLRTHVNKFHSALVEKSPESNQDKPEIRDYDGSQNSEGDRTEENEEYICPVCDKKLDTKSILLLHINSRHVLDRLRICLECAKMFDSQEALEEHIKKEHADSDLYSMIFNKRPKLMPSDVTKKPVKRTPKNVSKESNETGFQKITGANPGDLVYQCVKCSSTFEGEDAIQEHFQTDKDCMLKKAVEHKHSCPICKKTLKTNIAEHMRTHSDERPYECTICFSRFKRGHQLKMHVQSLHSDEAKFQCELCGRRFKRKDKLSCHYRSHTDDHPYMCTECGNVFKWKHHVKRHMMTVHQNIKRKESMKRHPCHICGKSFTWGHHVKRHLRNVHQVDTSNMGKFSNQMYRHKMFEVGAPSEKDAVDRDESMEEEGMDIDSKNNEMSKDGDSKSADAYFRSTDKGIMCDYDDDDDGESTDDNNDDTVMENRTSLEESNEKLRQLAEAVCREAESHLQNPVSKDMTSKEAQQTEGNVHKEESCLQNPITIDVTSKVAQQTEGDIHKAESCLQNPVTLDITSKVAESTEENAYKAESCLQNPVTLDITSKVEESTEGNVHKSESCLQNPKVLTVVNTDTEADSVTANSDS